MADRGFPVEAMTLTCYELEGKGRGKNFPIMKIIVSVAFTASSFTSESQVLPSLSASWEELRQQSKLSEHYPLLLEEFFSDGST